jgi:hypothetical protein
MTEFWNTYKILMVFLLLSFALPVNQLMGQENDGSSISATEDLENELLMSLEAGQTFDSNSDQNIIIIPDSKYNTDTYSANRSRNEINLLMEGDNNSAEATQEPLPGEYYGTGNLMNIEIDGNSNTARYHQQGNNNYIEDYVIGDDIYREINQTGNQLGIINQGRQSTPMIINQWGQGTKIIINGPPQ